MNRFSILDQAQRIKRPRLSGYSWIILLLVVLLIASLWLFVRYQIKHDYDRTIAEASQETMNLTKAFEEHVNRIVTHADTDLLHLKRAYERDGLSSPVFTADAMTTAEDPSRNLVAVYNEQGVVIASFIQNAVGAERSDREYFLVHRDAAAEKLHIGKPILTRLMPAQQIIPLTRRVNKPDGTFGGIVYIGLKTDYFLEFYNKIDLGQNQLIALSGTDGFNRARRVGNNTESGQDIRGNDSWKNFQEGRPSATYLSTNMLDGVTRVTSYRAMPQYPLIVTVGKSTQVALAGYQQRKQGYTLGASFVSLFILFFCGLLISRHEKTRRLTMTVQQEKDRLSALINSISDEVWFADTNKQLTLVNPSVLQEFSLSPAMQDVEEVAASFEVLRADGSLRPVEEAPPLRALQGETVRNQEEILRTPATGEWRNREVNASPVRDAKGNIIGSVSIVHDITERKRSEEMLVESMNRLVEINAELQKEISQRQAAQEALVESRDTLLKSEMQLRRFSDELMETNKEITSLANSIAHDFRSPMVNIKGFSHELEEVLCEMQNILRDESVRLPEKVQNKMDEILDQNVPEYLSFIYSSVDRLDRMINALLGLARMGRQALVVQNVDMGALVHQVCQSFRHQAETNQIQITLGQLPNVKANYLAMERIIGNLVDNAIKFLMPGRLGQIAITCIDEDDRYIFSVEDNGRGVDENDYDKIFQVFRRAGQQDVMGDGMGLAYVRTLIRQLGGRVWLESKLGAGTKMKFTIPKLSEDH